MEFCKDQARDEVIKVIDYLVDNFNFGEVLASSCYYTASNWFYNYMSPIARGDFDDFHFNRELLERAEKLHNDPFVSKFRFEFGQTKMVIIMDDLDYVIKIPFVRSERDYCVTEALNYEAALDEDLDYYFAWCAPVGYYKRMAEWDKFNFGSWRAITWEPMQKEVCAPIYVMEKVYCDEDAVSESLEGMGYSSMGCDEDDVWCLVEAAYGEEEYSKLKRFCTAMKINDLHTGNVGFRVMDDVTSLVFVDYSGYGLD